MADRGFSISDDLGNICITLDILVFLNSCEQLTKVGKK